MSMTPERQALKARLLNERITTIQDPDGEWVTALRCELCAKFDPPPSDMHEPVISRAEARGNSRVEAAILESELNAVILCNGCNLTVATAQWAREYLIRKQVVRYGADRIVAWIEGLGMKVPGPFILRVRNQAAQLEQWTREAAIPKEFA